MKFLRALGRSLTATVLSSLLLVLPIAYGVHYVLGKPTEIKHAIATSGIYNNATNTILDQVSKGNTDENTKKLLADPGIRAAIASAFPPSFVQTNTEGAIDATYDWLNGKTDKLDIKIKTADAKQQLVKNLSEYAQKRAATLPVCTRAQLRTIDPNGDILSIPCVPPGVNAKALADEFSQKLASQMDLPEEKTQAVNTSPANDKGREAFQLFMNKFWVLPTAAGVIAAAYVLVHRDKLLGLKRLARIVLINGILLGIIIGGSTLLFGKVTKMVSDSASEVQALQQNIMKLVDSLLGKFEHAVLIWVIGYIVMGAGTLIALHYYHKKKLPQPATPVK